ncbi:MAG TPA: group 1 truncated hemoglobin [Humisphaera sp.]
MAATATAPSLYEQLGGAAAVEAAVDTFYRKVLADDRVSRFFEDVDMDRQASKQKAFLTMVFGGPANYTGLDMRKGHVHLVKMGLDDSHVDAVIELLGQTLAELGVPAEKIGQVAAIAESVRDDVLCRPAGSKRGTPSQIDQVTKGGCGNCGCGN